MWQYRANHIDIFRHIAFSLFTKSARSWPARSLLLFVLVVSAGCDAGVRHADRDAKTIFYRQTPPDTHGAFSYEFQTSNAITEKRAGNEHGYSGVVQYVSAEGIPITMTYVADASGYHPSGDHIPATPLHVLKSLEYIRTHPPVDEKKSRKF